MTRILILCLILLVSIACGSIKTPPDMWTVSFKTSLPAPDNTFTLEINRTACPIGADHFYQLVTNGGINNTTGSYFADSAFFRVLPGFVVQFGIAGEPALSSYWEQFVLEDDPVVLSNTIGTIAYATGGPNTRTTQVFINYGDNSRLDALGFAPFGRVVSGMSSVIEKIVSQYSQDPDQSEIYAQGNSYLKKNFPNLTYIETTSVQSVM